MTGRVDRAAALLALAAGAHSLAVGLVLLFAPSLLVHLAGWSPPPRGFFVLQGGAFHVILAPGYVLEWRIHRRLRLLVLAKAGGTAFLAATLLLGLAPAAAAIALLGDAAFLAAGVLLDRALARSR